jgi:hypothetical protein
MTEGQMKASEEIQKECHILVTEMMAQNRPLSYQDCTNVFLFTKLAILQEEIRELRAALYPLEK